MAVPARGLHAVVRPLTLVGIIAQVRDQLVVLVKDGSASAEVGDEQVRGDVLRANVVDVADETERLFGLAIRAVELCPLLGRQQRALRGKGDNGGNEQDSGEPRGWMETTTASEFSWD